MQPNQEIQQNKNLGQQVQPALPTQNRPEKKFQAGTISITVWKNSVLKDGKQLEYRTISVGRSYKKNGAWQNSTASVRVNDLPKLSAMLDEAYKYLVINTKFELHESHEQEGGQDAIVM